ncbi:MAG: cupin domain-containing protein, partial [Candidatus Latescibacteria bacterium]|nr:cupin domain-containing protein [Candidatus Latescibacterota bacterium]
PVEKHFHDHDETWIVTRGKCTAFMVDLEGVESEFPLEAGDVWMVEAGVEHGCDPLDGGVWIFPLNGSLPEGSHKPGHYYMEQENYLPRLTVEKVATDRYRK